MAITKYLQKCDYSIGGLQPYIYLIHKNTLTVRIKAKGVEVFFKEVPKNGAETEIYKIYGASCVYNQEETYHNKYRFNSTLELTINEQYKEPFLYGLRTLRTNQYYIIVEDKKGTQYLINPELYTNLNYEYNFFDGGDTQNSCIISWNNLSNYPLLIMDEKIDNNFVLLFEECPYNIGSIEWLRICHKGELSTKDDGVKITDMYFSNIDLLHTIDFLKETFTYNETYDGNMFRTTLSFSIPLSDNQFNWHYNLLEFEKNRYTAFFKTTNHNYFVSGVEKGLRPKYNITTSEDDETPNMINITFEQTSQYPMIWTDSVVQYQWREDEQMCIGYDKYQMLAQQYSLDWGRTWVDTNPIVKKKGDIIESDSEECKKYQWVENGEVCVVDSNEIVKWKETDGYICQDCGKYRKLQKMVSTDSGKTFKDTDEYYIGAPMLDEEGDCQFVMARWVDVDNQYLCFPVDETKTKWEVNGTICKDYDLHQNVKELITNNGNIYYESGIIDYGDIIKENCCACGYINTEYRYDSTVCSTAITETSFTETRTYDIINEWTVDTFTIKGEGTYTITPDLINNKSSNYIALSHLDTDLKLIATTNTSTATTSDYNRGVIYYGSSKYGTWSFTINDDLEHTFQVGTYLSNTYSGYTGETAVVTVTSPKQDYSSYDKYYLWEYCYDNYETVDRQTETYKYELNEYHSCDCEWTGTTWQWDGEEYVCGSDIELPTLTINRVQGDWIRDGNTFTSNDINDSQVTIERIYFSVSEPINIKFTIDQDSEKNYDFLVISNLDAEVVSGHPTSIGSSYNYYHHSGKTTGSTSMTISNTSEHFVELMYRKDGGASKGRDNVIVTLGIKPYDVTSEYEVWRETNCDGFTGKVDYRNPQKSCKCDYREYDWEWDETWEDAYICGSDIGVLETTFITISSNTDRTIPMQTFRIDATDPQNNAYYYIRFTTTPDTDTTDNNGFSICPDVGTIYDNGTVKSITAQTKIEGKIYEYTFSVPVYFSNAEKNAPVSQVKYFGDVNAVPTSEYEVWKEYEYCPISDGYKSYTGKVDYRNPKKSYKCDYVSYQWREEENNVCGNALPENTTEVKKAPELNTDFE